MRNHIGPLPAIVWPKKMTAIAPMTIADRLQLRARDNQNSLTPMARMNAIDKNRNSVARSADSAPAFVKRNIWLTGYAIAPTTSTRAVALARWRHQMQKTPIGSPSNINSTEAYAITLPHKGHIKPEAS